MKKHQMRIKNQGENSKKKKEEKVQREEEKKKKKPSLKKQNNYIYSIIQITMFYMATLRENFYGKRERGLKKPR